MDANNICNCELCNPNWHLGESGDFVAVPREDASELKRTHAQKLEAAGMVPAASLAFAD